MKLTQEQTEKLKTLKTMEEVRAFFETERIELSPEELEKVTGGGFFDGIRDIAEWIKKKITDESDTSGDTAPAKEN